MESLSFDSLASALRADSGDLSTFHEVLSQKLEQALPSGAVKSRRGGMPWHAKRPLESLVVDLGDESFEATHARGGFEYRIAKVVRGITVKSQSVDFPVWLDALIKALWEHANASEAARQSLERFLL